MARLQRSFAGTDKEDKTSLAIYRADGDSYREWKRIIQPDDKLKYSGQISISADGKRLAVVHSDQFVRVWRFEGGSDMTPTDFHYAGWASRMQLSPNGRFLVLTDAEHRTSLLDLHKGQSANFRPLLEGASVNSIAFSPDERYLALGTDNDTARVFDITLPEGEIANLLHTGWITAMAFSDDSKYLATATDQINGNESYPVRIWLLQPADLIAEAQSRLAPFQQNDPPSR